MTIRNKIFIYIFSSSLIIIIGVLMAVRYWLPDFYLKKTINHEKNIVTLLALESKDLLLTNDLMELQGLYQSTIKSNLHITYIFAEKDGNVMTHTFKRGVPRGLLNLGDFSDQFGPDIIPIENDEGFLIYHFRVKVGKPCFAILHLGLSVQSLEAELIPLRRAMILVGCFLLAVVPFGVAYILSRIISKPISTLSHGSERIGRGELDYRLDIKTGDEIEQLADKFNDMSERLEKSYATLEQKVVERTENLQQEIDERKKALDELKRHKRMLEDSEKNLKKFSRKLLTIREEEKRKLSNSLHDDIGSMTIALLFNLGTIETEIRENNMQDAFNMINQTKDQVKASVNKLKNISKGLRPLDIDITGLPDALRQHFSNIEEQAKIKIDFSENVDEKKISDETTIILYRVNQEALNNILKHAGAKKVKIRLFFQADTLQLTIRDDGKGFDVEEVLQETDGFGLRGMREGIESLGGMFVIKSTPKKGTEISVTIPNI